MLLAGSNCLWKCFKQEVIAFGNAFSGKQLPGNVHVGDLFDPNYLLEPPLLAGYNKDESDQKSAANIYKSVHITSRRRKLDSACYMAKTK